MADTRRNTTIADVARLAGVSTGTVSNVLGNGAMVRPETRNRVLAAIAQLNYSPNRIAQSLTRQRTDVIGMLVPDVTNPFFSELLLGAEVQLEAAGYAVVFGNSRDSDGTQVRYLNSFRERRVDGLIVVLSPDPDGAALEDVASDIPVVLADRSLPGWAGDQVIGDDDKGMEMAITHLVALGHRDVALINGDPRLSTAQRRLRGFEASLRAHGLAPMAITSGSFTLDSGLAQAKLLFEGSRRPTAVCAGNDLLALAACTAFAEMGIRVPADVSIVGYDDISYARLVAPRLTTVRQPAQEMGAMAARLLIERLNQGSREGRTVVVQPELVVRGSTAPANSP